VAARAGNARVVPVSGRRALGAAGEQRAAEWYAARGYQVLDRNWRCRDGELDLIVRLGATVAFSEVKARSSDRFGYPVEAVTRAKQVRIRRLATRWLRERAGSFGPRPTVIRFDVVSVLDGRLEVLEGAF
jgi:putative endonuclease